MRKKNVKLSDLDEKEICELYLKGDGIQKLVVNYNVNDSRIHYILKKFKIKKRKSKFSNKSSLLDKENMVALYKSGKTLEEVADLFLIWPNAVKSIIKNRGVILRKCEEYSITKIDADFFKIKSVELAYFYGFVLGDGTFRLFKKIPMLKIALHTKDEDTLYMFAKWMKMDDNKNFYIYKNKKCTEFHVRNNILNINKAYWGCVENKTYYPIIPNLKNKNLLRPFLIGLIDADGHISKNGNFQLVNNTVIINWFEDMLKFLGFKGNIIIKNYKGKVWSRLFINKKNDVKELCNLLRAAEFDFIFKRKWDNLIKSTQKSVGA